MPNVPDFESDVLTESEIRVDKPPLYKVVLHNDDFTTMDFVIYVLRVVFHRSDMEAFAIMMKVHNEGVGTAGVYTLEVAKMKAEKAMALARKEEFPFLCTVEEE
jgi:ATP-dependent Clp protease adaptor protein ClpS